MIFKYLIHYLGFPGGSVIKNLPINAGDVGLTPVFSLGESHRQRSLVGYSPWGCKESDTMHAHVEKKELF